MFEQGTIIYFTPFYFKNGNTPAPKFFLVLKSTETSSVLACLPTSKDYIPNFSVTQSGCIEIPEANFNCYLFQPNIIISDNGFAFSEKTLLYGHLIEEYPLDFFEQYPYENIDYTIKGKIKADIFDNMISCFKDSTSVKRKFKRLL